jgi:hypothetical protein
MLMTDRGLEEPRSSMGGIHRDLVNRVISSSTFNTSERLSSFLYYICDLTLKGRAHEINEQRIGEAVFGRSQDYDSSIDGIVRTQGSRLRQRLDRYFSTEGIDEPITIVMPRGGYVPIFEARLPAPVVPVPPPPLTLPPDESTPAHDLHETAPEIQQNRATPLFAWVLIALLALAVVGLYLRRGPAIAETHEDRAATHPLWSHLFLKGQRTLVIPGDSGLVIWEGLMGRKLGLADFLKGDYRNDNHPKDATSPQSIAADLSNRRYTSIVDVEVMQYLSSIALSEKGKLEMRYARDLRPNDLKEGNIVLVGASEANPWVELYEPLMNFTFSEDPANHLASIYNRAPQGNEPQRWDLEAGKAYSVIAYLPGLTGNGNSLILGGTSMTGTESALDFLSDDSQLLPFLKRLQRPDGKLPHFQIVLGTNGVSGSSVRSSILAWRVTD